MNYVEYIQDKLEVSEITEIVDKAVRFLGMDYPTSDNNLQGFEIVDLWIEKIKLKWNIELKTLNLYQPNFLGKLEPKYNGFIINLNKNLFITQKRFTVAHEIAHILSYNTTYTWPVYEIRHSKIEEYYCDRIARAMLLPQTLINFKKFDLTNIDREQVNYIKRLWPEFKVSPWQILKKLFDDSGTNSLIGIFWEYYKKESCLKIIDYHHPKNIFIPKNDRVFLDTLLKKKKTNYSPEKAFNTNDIVHEDDLIEIGSLYKKKLNNIAFPIKTKAATYVIQIIRI